MAVVHGLGISVLSTTAHNHDSEVLVELYMASLIRISCSWASRWTSNEYYAKEDTEQYYK